MAFEEETEYSTAYYRCIDPIENFRIKVVLQPVKTLHIPLPQLDTEFSSEILMSPEENESETEEYTFKWQEKIFNRSEIKKYSSDTDWKQKLIEKYHDNFTDGLSNLKSYPNKLFSYVEADKFALSEYDLNVFMEKNSFVSSLSKKMEDLSIVQYGKHYKNISNRKIINYYPSEEFKKQTHLINKNLEKMFIMVDLNSKDVQTNKTKEYQHEGVLVSLCYNQSNCVLQITPSFSKSKLKPYTIGRHDENGKHYYYYWVYHESSGIKSENLTKEIQLMSKVFDYQEEVRKLQLDTDFFVGKPENFYITVYGEIISAQDFEYDNLHIHYFVKLPPGWGYSDIDSLMGRTQTSNKNSQGTCYFSHLFEMNFCIDISSITDSTPTPLELFFEVLSVDKYKRYRNEGYTYLTISDHPGMQTHTLRCWRILDQSITSQLERFFIGGGAELEDVSYVGLSPNEKGDVMSRFGLETAPSGLIKVKLNILHQSVNLAVERDKEDKSEKSLVNRLDAGSLLGSVNAVLEAFRKARERMLEAKKGLQTNFTFSDTPKSENEEKFK